MARVIVKDNIRIGHVYECIFGLFKKLPHYIGDDPDSPATTTLKHEAVENDYDYRIPNELIKKRAVVVIGKNSGQYVVVPVSSTQAIHKKPRKYPEALGLHVRLLEEDLPNAGKYADTKPRWAKCDLVTTVDGGRFRDIYDECSQRHVTAHAVTADTLRDIRYGVMRAIGLRDLIPSVAAAPEALSSCPDA